VAADGGIIVDDRMETNIKGVYAVNKYKKIFYVKFFFYLNIFSTKSQQDR
jgi:alkyl hydroperoxide reductase subunit AhpF